MGASVRAETGTFHNPVVDFQLEENPENLIERGQVFAAQSKWQKAIDDYTLYIKLREGVPYPYRLRSVARKQLGRNGDLRGGHWVPLSRT